jgi:hypothetical protein
LRSAALSVMSQFAMFINTIVPKLGKVCPRIKKARRDVVPPETKWRVQQDVRDGKAQQVCENVLFLFIMCLVDVRIIVCLLVNTPSALSVPLPFWCSAESGGR